MGCGVSELVASWFGVYVYIGVYGCGKTVWVQTPEENVDRWMGDWAR
jgi:hypothetical protein